MPMTSLPVSYALDSSVPVNTPEPVPLENELLRGRILLMHRLPDGQPFQWEEYFETLEKSTGKPSVCEIQVQFEFKVEPRGTLWFGGEIHRPMELGIATRATCKVILSLLRKFADLPLHYSFGSVDEHAHICFPLRQAKMLVTDASQPWPELGATLPAIGYPQGLPELTTGQVYTLAFSMRVIDLMQWELCNAPGLSGMKLTSFWKQNPLHIVIYDVPGSSEGAKVKHRIRDKRCFLHIQLSNACLQGSDEAPGTPEPRRPAPEARESLRCLSKAIIEDQTDGDAADAPDDVSDDGFGSCISESEMDWCSVVCEGDLLQDDIDCMHDPRAGLSTFFDTGQVPTPLYVSIPWVVTNGDQHVAVLEVRSEAAGAPNLSCRTWQELLELEALVEGGQRRRARTNLDVQQLELDRGRLIALFAVLADPQPASEALAVRRDVLAAFLRDRHPVDWSLWFQRRVGYVAYEGRILVSPLERKRGRLHFAGERLDLSAVAQVRAAGPADPLLRQFVCFEICTWERCYTFLTNSSEVQRSVLAGAGALQRSWLRAPRLSKKAWDVRRLEDHSGLHRWQPSRRRVWNDRRLALEPFSGDPVALSWDLLAAVAQAQVRHPMGGLGSASPARLGELADMAGALKRVDLTGLQNWDLLAFWLNVYHALLIHARLASPELQQVRKFVGFHNFTSYIVAGQPWSLTEIEHIILRCRSLAQHTSNLLYRWLACAWERRTPVEKAGCLMGHPNVLCGSEAHWQQFQVTPDRRLNFVLNCGTESCAPEVVAFRAGDGEAQLQFACRLFFRSFSLLDSAGVPQLPRTLKWYVEDSPDGTAEGWLPYLSKLLELSLPLGGPLNFARYFWQPRGFLEVVAFR